ncbi:MAG: hypothetical protein WC765_02995 [Phycisphaerae bacterium]|jgi:hypothetical protein
MLRKCSWGADSFPRAEVEPQRRRGTEIQALTCDFTYEWAAPHAAALRAPVYDCDDPADAEFFDDDSWADPFGGAKMPVPK